MNQSSYPTNHPRKSKRFLLSLIKYINNWGTINRTRISAFNKILLSIFYRQSISINIQNLSNKKRMSFLIKLSSKKLRFMHQACNHLMIWRFKWKNYLRKIKITLFTFSRQSRSKNRWSLISYLWIR